MNINLVIEEFNEKRKVIFRLFLKSKKEINLEIENFFGFTDQLRKAVLDLIIDWGWQFQTSG